MTRQFRTIKLKIAYFIPVPHHHWRLDKNDKQDGVTLRSALMYSHASWHENDVKSFQIFSRFEQKMGKQNGRTHSLSHKANFNNAFVNWVHSKSPIMLWNGSTQEMHSEPIHLPNSNYGVSLVHSMLLLNKMVQARKNVTMELIRHAEDSMAKI